MSKYNVSSVGLTIILPVYNNEGTIKRCINSILEQSYQNFRLLIILREGKDNTLQIVKSYKDKRVDIIIQKQTIGPGNARNIGINIAKSKWLGFVEADDYIDKVYFEKLITKAENEDLDCVCGNIIITHNIWFNAKKNNIFTTLDDKISILKNGACFNKIFKNEIVKDNKISFATTYRFEDNIFLIKYLYYSKKIGFSNTNYYYFPSKWSLCYTKILKKDSIKATKDILSFCKEVKFPNKTISRLKEILIYNFIISFLSDFKYYLCQLLILKKFKILTCLFIKKLERKFIRKLHLSIIKISRILYR